VYLELIDVGLLGLGSWTAQLGYSALLPGWAGGWAGEIEIESIDCQHIGCGASGSKRVSRSIRASGGMGCSNMGSYIEGRK